MLTSVIRELLCDLLLFFNLLLEFSDALIPPLQLLAKTIHFLF